MGSILRHEIILLVLALSLLAFLLFYRLGSTYLTNWDEAWYADISRNMLETGNLIRPIWNGEPFFEKPPLYFWLSALFFKLFNISEFTVRFTSALSAIGTTAVAYFLARELFNKNIAFLSVFILASFPIFLYRSRTGNIDTLLTLFLLFCLYAFYKAYTKDTKWFFLMGVSLAFAFLTKGIVGLYPILIIGIFLISQRRFNILRSKNFLLGLALAIFSIMFWLYISIAINGQAFLNQFIISNAEKLGLGVNIANHFSFEYVGHLKSGLKIWFLFLPISLLYSFFKIKQKGVFLLLFYAFIFFIVMSFSNEKSNWFILPIYPVIAIIIAFAIYSFFVRFFNVKFRWVFFSFVFIIALTQNIFYKNDYIPPDIAGDEARVALAARSNTNENDLIYLTNYYFPTTVYYSRRKTYAVYSEHEVNSTWWIKAKAQWRNILQEKRVFIITTKEELESLKNSFSDYKFDVLYQSGQKILLKKV